MRELALVLKKMLKKNTSARRKVFFHLICFYSYQTSYFRLWKQQTNNYSITITTPLIQNMIIEDSERQWGLQDIDSLGYLCIFAYIIDIISRNTPLYY